MAAIILQIVLSIEIPDMNSCRRRQAALPFPTPPVFPFRSCRYHLTLTDTCNVCNGLATKGRTGKRMSHSNTSLSRNIIDGTGGDGIWALGHYGDRYRSGRCH